MTSVRTFGMSDQEAFARLSGDYNPLHVDAVAARRLMFGRPVVHGVHTLLWALDTCLACKPSPVRIGELEAYFLKPSGVGEPHTLRLEMDKWPDVSLVISSRAMDATRVRVTFEDTPQTSEDAPIHPSVDPVRVPLERSLDELPHARGELDLYLDGELSGELLPNLTSYVPHNQIAALLATTRLVGMHCPGLHSVYSELKLRPDAQLKPRTFSYKVKQVHQRFGLVQLEVRASPWTGHIRAFLRPPPVAQPSLESLKGLVAADEFDGQRALVIGGSRGLGEVTAKLLAAGGAHVHFTYHRGETEARALEAEARSHHMDLVSHPYDVLDPATYATSRLTEGWHPTHWYYFATPFIAPGSGHTFSDELFDRFYEMYVTAFERIYRLLHAGGVHHVMYPSTIFLDEPPANLAEYVAAKRSGEAMGRFLATAYDRSVVYMPRLPRLATDQTASIVPVQNADPAAAILPELRRFRRATAGAQTAL